MPGSFRSLSIFILFCLIACQNRFPDKKALEEYIADPANGYRYSKSVNGVNFVLQYRPIDLLVEQEVINRNKEAAQHARERFSPYMYFNLYISERDTELLTNRVIEKEAFGSMVQRLSFDIDKNVYLYTPYKDTLQMADFIYPRMYGNTSSTAIMVVFKRSSAALESKYLNFVIKDLGAETGDIRFKIDTEAIRKEPALTF